MSTGEYQWLAKGVQLRLLMKRGKCESHCEISYNIHRDELQLWLSVGDRFAEVPLERKDSRAAMMDEICRAADVAIDLVWPLEIVA